MEGLGSCLPTFKEMWAESAFLEKPHQSSQLQAESLKRELQGLGGLVVQSVCWKGIIRPGVKAPLIPNSQYKGLPLVQAPLGLSLLAPDAEGSENPVTHMPSSAASRNFSMTSNTVTWRRSHWTSQSGTMTSASPMITLVSAPSSWAKRYPLSSQEMQRFEDPALLWQLLCPNAKSGPRVLIWVQFGLQSWEDWIMIGYLLNKSPPVE